MLLAFDSIINVDRLDAYDFPAGQTALELERHLDRGMCPPLNQLDKNAREAVSWLDDRAIFCALHQACIGRHVEPACLVTLATRLVAIQAVVVEYGIGDKVKSGVWPVCSMMRQAASFC